MEAGFLPGEGVEIAVKVKEACLEWRLIDDDDAVRILNLKMAIFFVPPETVQVTCYQQLAIS